MTMLAEVADAVIGVDTHLDTHALQIPIPADSGKTQHRHRHDRGGDRALNRALHTIAHTRMVSDPRTRDYVARRTALGKTRNEIRRCLKRYIARELFRDLNTALAA